MNKYKNFFYYSLLCAFFIQISLIGTMHFKIKNKEENFSQAVANLSVKHLDELTSLFLTYDVFDEHGPLKMVRHGKENDGGYVVPELALQKADVLLGYGICNDISFEERFADIYKKRSYGIECATKKIEIKNPLCTFIRKCIANDKYIYSNQKSSGMFSTFSEQLNDLKIKDQNIFVKMDIEGAEYEAFQDIFPHANNITGIVLEIHFIGWAELLQAISLMKNLQKDFYLVHVHANNCVQPQYLSVNAHGAIPKVVELTYINKKLVKTAKISENQKHPSNLDMENCPTKEPYAFEVLPQLSVPTTPQSH